MKSTPTLIDSDGAKDINNNTIDTLDNSTQRLRKLKNQMWQRLQDHASALSTQTIIRTTTKLYMPQCKNSHPFLQNISRVAERSNPINLQNINEAEKELDIAYKLHNPAMTNILESKYPKYHKMKNLESKYHKQLEEPRKNS
ncbi:hypothetical protein ACFX1S_045843 [Malus domestica]